MAAGEESRKRVHAYMEDGSFDHNDIRIVTADRPAGFPANASILRLVSSAARASLSAGATTWDLTCITVNAKPVTGAVVERWLRAVSEMVPTTDSKTTKMTTAPAIVDLHELKDVVLFADAIGGMGPVRKVLLGPSDQRYALRVRLPAGTDDNKVIDFALRIEGSVVYKIGYAKKAIIEADAIAGTNKITNVVPAACDALAAALEEWLYFSCRHEFLGLARLLLNTVRVVGLGFRAAATMTSSDVSALISPRVMEAVPRSLLVEAWLKQALVIDDVSVSAGVVNRLHDYVDLNLLPRTVAAAAAMGGAKANLPMSRTTRLYWEGITIDDNPMTCRVAPHGTDEAIAELIDRLKRRA